MNHHRKPLLGILLLAFTLAACVPVTVPGLRHIDKQTWSAHFEVEAQVAGATVRLPVQVALTFEQRRQNVTADATLEYDAGIFRLQTGRIVELEGRLGFDDHLDLRSASGALTFNGSFRGETLVGDLSIAGVLPVGSVTFTRER